MSARDVIEDGLRKLTILQAGEAASASEASDGLDVLNDMLHGWPTDLQHVDLTLSDDLQVPPDHLRAIKFNFAIEYASQFGKQIPPSVAAIANASLRDLQNRYANPARLNAQQFKRKPFDIDTG